MLVATSYVGLGKPNSEAEFPFFSAVCCTGATAAPAVIDVVPVVALAVIVVLVVEAMVLAVGVQTIMVRLVS